MRFQRFQEGKSTHPEHINLFKIKSHKLLIVQFDGDRRRQVLEQRGGGRKNQVQAKR